MCEYNFIDIDISKIIVQIIKEREDFIRNFDENLKAQERINREGEN